MIKWLKDLFSDAPAIELDDAVKKLEEACREEERKFWDALKTQKETLKKIAPTGTYIEYLGMKCIVTGHSGGPYRSGLRIQYVTECGLKDHFIPYELAIGLYGDAEGLPDDGKEAE